MTDTTEEPQETRPLDPRLWSDERKLVHSLAMVDKLESRHPQLAEVWRRSVEILRSRMDKHHA